MGVNTQSGSDLPHSARYLVYINGVRVPALGVRVTSGVFQPMEAELELAPHRLIARLGAEDRAQVAVFYLDSWYNEEIPNWCLLFEGHITGWSYTNRGDSRKFVFSVQSNLAVLTQLFLYFLSGESDSVGRKAKSDSDYPNQLKLRGKYPLQFFTAGLTSKKEMTRPFDIIENIIYAVLGEHRGKVRNLSGGSVKAELGRLKIVLSANSEARAKRLAKRQVENAISSESKEVSPEEKADRIVKKTAELLTKATSSESQKLIDRALVLAPGEKSLTNGDIKAKQNAALKLLAEKTATRRSLLSKSITQTGYFARYMRLTRFLEHWVASPYVEGIPGKANPISDIEGGGVFPLLRAVKAKKVYRAIAKQAGIKFGQHAHVWNLVHHVFSFLYYEVLEVLAPPALTVDKYALPKGSFYKYAGDRERDFESDFEEPISYTEWGQAASKDKARVCIGSYLTKPQIFFGLPPSCNVFFPSMWMDYHYNENYSAQPTRVYFNRTGPMKKLNMGSNAPGYAYSTTRVGFPAVIERHIQDASATSSSDMELLVFPEEYFRGPSPLLQDVPLMFTNIQKVANSRRFSRLTDEEEELKYQLSKEQEAAGNPIYAERAALTIKTSERVSKKGHSMHALYFLLAQQEYYKTRYENNSGGVASVFNPYVVAGFPMAVFDRDSMGVNILGTAMSVTHTLSETEFSTAVNFNFCRTFEEMFAALQSDGAALDIAPQNPVSELQDIFQYMPTANQYYGALFRADEIGEFSEKTLAEVLQRDARSPGVMDYRLLVGWNIDGEPDKNRILTRSLTGPEMAAILESPDDFVEVAMDDTNVKIHLNTPVAPLSTARPLWDSTQTALRYCSRPVCTLEQYIDFYAVAGLGKTGLDPVGRGRGIRVGVRKEGPGIPLYYNIIRQFIGGPGIEPGSKLATTDDEGNPQARFSLETIDENGDVVVVSVVEAGDKGTYADLPDSRKDWQELLIQYVSSISDTNPKGDPVAKDLVGVMD